MNELLKTVLSLSLSGSLVILLLMLGKPLLKDRVSRRWQYYIWLVAVARLLLPLTPEASPVGALFRQTERPAVEIGTAAVWEEYPVMTPEPKGDAEGPGEGAAPLSAWDAAAVGRVLWLVWPGAALFLLLRKITVYQSFAAYIRAGRREVSDVELLDRLARIGEQAGVRRPVELYTHELISSPLLLGFFRPCIVLPTADLPEADLDFIIRHELTHYRRGDVLYKWLVQLTVCLHWFNPLVWRMSREISRACELSCDEAVIRTLDADGRRAYGDTLLRALETGGTYRDSAVSVTLHESAELLKERLGAIMNVKRRSPWAAVLSAVLAAALTVGAAAAGAYSKPAEAADFHTLSERQKGRETRDAETWTVDGTVFRYGQAAYDLALRSALVTSITACTPVGRHIVVEGHCGPQNSLYCIFDTKTQAIEREITGAHLIWRGEDITTAVYSFQGEILDYEGNRIGTCGLKEGEYIYGLSFSGGEVQALVLTPEMEERTLRFAPGTPDSRSPAAQAERFYRSGSLPLFGAVFSRMDRADQRTWLERLYAGDSTAFFSVAVREADGGLLEDFAERVYQDGRISFFSVLADRMDEEALESWLDRALEDERWSFQSMLYQKLDRDWEWERTKAELEKQRLAEYAAHGVTREGGAYYYQGSMVYIFLDQSGVFRNIHCLDMNPAGSVSVKVIRDEDDRIQRVENLTPAEVAELLGESDEEDGWDDLEEDGRRTVPVEIDRMGDGEFVWLGTFRLDKGDQLLYRVSAETGEGLRVGFSEPGQKRPDTTYMTVETRREDGELEVQSGPMVWKEPLKAGEYCLFVQAGRGQLTNVTGYVTIMKADGD